MADSPRGESHDVDVDGLLGDDQPSFGAKWCCGLKTVTQLVLVATLGSFQLGFSLSVLNTSKAHIVVDLGWCHSEKGNYWGCNRGLLYGSIVNSAVFGGAFVGCLLAEVFTSSGRRLCIIVTHSMFALASIFSAAAEGFVTLLIGRAVAGIACGLFTMAIPLYISEVTPDEWRGFYGALHQLALTFGIFVGALLGLAFGPTPPVNEVFTLSSFQRVWWRALLGFPALLSFIALVLVVWVYPFDTPHYMIGVDQKPKAAALLREIYQKDDISTELRRIVKSRQQPTSREPLTVGRAFLVDPAYRKVILLACFLSIMQQASGANVFVANSNNLYESLKLSPGLITGLTVALLGLNFVVTIVSVPLVDFLGRRSLLLFSLLVSFAAQATALIANLVDAKSTAVQWITVGCLYLFLAGFAVGYGPVLMVYTTEIFPSDIKEGATGLVASLNWLTSLIMVLPSDFLFKERFTVFLGLCVASLAVTLVVLFLFMKETKGLSVDESPYFTKSPSLVPATGEPPVSPSARTLSATDDSSPRSSTV